MKLIDNPKPYEIVLATHFTRSWLDFNEEIWFGRNEDGTYYERHDTRTYFIQDQIDNVIFTFGGQDWYCDETTRQYMERCEFEPEEPPLYYQPEWSFDHPGGPVDDWNDLSRMLGEAHEQVAANWPFPEKEQA